MEGSVNSKKKYRGDTDASARKVMKEVIVKKLFATTVIQVTYVKAF